MSEVAAPSAREAGWPTTWGGVEDFAEWWCAEGMPMLVPFDAKVYATDNAASIAVFRQGKFQVEMYLIHPSTPLPEHGHPGVDVIQMRLDAEMDLRTGLQRQGDLWGLRTPVLTSGRVHSGQERALSSPQGLLLVVFEHWLDAEPTSAAVAWAGETVGPIHEAIIRQHYPNAFIERGYADITKPANYRELLGGK